MTFLQDDIITPDLLPPRIVSRAQENQSRQSVQAPSSAANTSLKGFLKLKEKEYLDKILTSTHGDKEKAAQTLQVSLATLYRKLSDETPPSGASPAAPAAEG
ncbi:MAG: helix-turn-helix domain-containing protein [Kiritimatiellae bacterium]|nr:helix-turn-helix domain-containing protein [Kiritimatiellia bacterium]